VYGERRVLDEDMLSATLAARMRMRVLRAMTRVAPCALRYFLSPPG
jgi:hypothetical protein